MKNFMSGGSGF